MDRKTGDSTYQSRVERYNYIIKRRAEKATIQTIANELGIAKQNVGRYLVRGTVRPSGRQPSNAGRKARLTKRIAHWQQRRLNKLGAGLDVSYEDGWIADLEGRLRDLG
jgi:IS30 family transposase